MPDMVDPKPWLEYGALGGALLTTFFNLMFFAWMSAKFFTLFRELVPMLESVKGYCRALMERDNNKARR